MSEGMKRARNSANSDSTGKGSMAGARRIPMNLPQQKLPVPHLDGFMCRWFNDVPGRLVRAKNAGWEHVTVTEAAEVGAEAVSEIGEGEYVCRVVGANGPNGGPLIGYLMKQKSEWFNEDQEAKQAAIRKKEQVVYKGEVADTNNARRYLGNETSVVNNLG